MGGCRCTFKTCQNNTKTTDNIHFFHYPVKQKERCRKWIHSAEKLHFCDLEEDQLRNKVVCELHFEDKWFPNHQKKRLLQGAIPTLDGDCLMTYEALEQDVSQDGPTYINQEMHDIQILPANNDGTVFLLDTDAMFNRSPKVESYTYKNGVLVPSTESEEAPMLARRVAAAVAQPRQRQSRTPKLERALLRGPKRELDETEYSNVRVKKEVPDTDNYNAENGNENQAYNMRNTEGTSIQKKLPVKPNILKSSSSKAPATKSLDSDYMNTLQQHSKEIATIKKLLKEKSLLAPELDMDSILATLRPKLPPTFFTMLGLNLNNKCDLTEEDVEFFMRIHTMSPEVYQLLVEKYKWNLPCIDDVE